MRHFRAMSTITAILEPDADGSLHLPLPSEMRRGKIKVVASLTAVSGDAEPMPARIVPIPPARGARPKVGEVTSAPVRWSAESFAALDEEGIRDLGLL